MRTHTKNSPVNSGGGLPTQKAPRPENKIAQAWLSSKDKKQGGSFLTHPILRHFPPSQQNFRSELASLEAFTRPPLKIP